MPGKFNGRHVPSDNECFTVVLRVLEEGLQASILSYLTGVTENQNCSCPSPLLVPFSWRVL